MQNAIMQTLNGGAKNFANQKANAARLLEYIKQTDPNFYRFASQNMGSGLGEVASEPKKTSIFDRLTDLASTYYQARQQRDMMKLQIQRAKQGQPPLDLTRYSAPPIKVDVDSSQIRAAASDSLKQYAKPALLLGGLFFAWWFYNKNLKKSK